MMIYIDPPSGWKYGFPKKVDENSDFRQILIDAGYPEKDLDFALRYMRSWRDENEGI